MTRVRILHISDLHEGSACDGMPEARQRVLELDAEERGYVLGPTFQKALEDSGRGGVDLVCFTGDLTDWGHPTEYAAASRRLRTILDAVGARVEQFFAVPGNHDIQRPVNEEAW